MTSQLFSPGIVITSPWLNDVNTATNSRLTSIGGTATNITAVGPVSMTAYVAGQRFSFTPTANNPGGSVTININGLGNRAITKLGITSLVAQDLLVGVVAEMEYDGAGFQLINPQTFNLTQNVPVANISGILPVNKGGTGNDGTGWTGVSCAIAANTGALTDANAVLVYQKVGRLVTFTLIATVITNGTGGGSINVTIPFTAANECSWGGRENAATGLAISGTVATSTNVLRIFKYDNTYPAANGTRMVISGVLNTTT